MTFEEKLISEENSSGKSTKVDLPILSFATQEEFESWQMLNHTDMKGIWVRFYKKNSGIKSIVYAEALDVALCYGWIDGQLKKYDEASYIQKFTPRRKKSMWSIRNQEHVARLAKEGKMKPSGLMEVERAKADGRWDKAYNSPSNMEVPEDFIQLLSQHPKAFLFFESLNKTNRYTIGYRLQTAKTSETREKRLKEILAMLEKEQKFH